MSSPHSRHLFAVDLASGMRMTNLWPSGVAEKVLAEACIASGWLHNTSSLVKGLCSRPPRAVNSLLDPWGGPLRQAPTLRHTRKFIHTHTPKQTQHTQEHECYAALRRAARAPQPAIRPAGVRVVDGVEDEAAVAARRPARAADGPRPGATGVQMRGALLHGYRVVGAGALIAIRVVA